MEAIIKHNQTHFDTEPQRWEKIIPTKKKKKERKAPRRWFLLGDFKSWETPATGQKSTLRPQWPDHLLGLGTSVTKISQYLQHLADDDHYDD